MSEPTNPAATSPAPPLRILRLEADSFKRLRAVSIKPDGSVIRITGRNGAGKSSVLDAIMFAIGGARLAPEKPIRKGAKAARVEVDLGEMVVRRRATESGVAVEIEAKDGSTLKSPQAVLDRLVGDLSFDPLAFTRLDDKDRIGVLKRVTGLGAQFDQLDKKREDLTEERRVINAQQKQAEARLAGEPAVPEGTPDDEVSVAGLAHEYRAAQDQILDNQRKRAWLSNAVAIVQKWSDRITELEKALAEARQAHAKAHDQLDENQPKIAALVDPDTTKLLARLESAENTNICVRRKRERAEGIATREKLVAQSRQLTRSLEDLEESKAALLAGSKMPVPGLAFGEAGVTLNGVPFSQASSSEQLRASVAMGLAQNPRLRVMLVREGSLLDSASMGELEKIATEHDAQVWVEQVTDGQKVGIVIEDGEVAGQELQT